ncbi:MAG TPA: hypothetical protein DCS97_04090 [Planctomycetes bacterium]|nr:hypothetical protein [Planctomycetota bacterium]
MTATLGESSVLGYGATRSTISTLAGVRDLSLGLVTDDTDITPHASGGWRSHTHGRKNAEISWEMLWDGTDAGQLAIRDAYLNDTAVELQITGSVGFIVTCAITGMRQIQGLGSAIVVSVTARPTLSAEDPAWLDVLTDLDNGEPVTDLDNGEPVLVAA